MVAGGAQGARQVTGVHVSAVPTGNYFSSHAAGHNEFTGGFTLHGSSITAVGITTDLLACTRPPSKKVQFPGPPDNWQPQKTIPVHKHGVNLVFSYSGSFADRISGYPQALQITGTITPAGIVTGRAAMQFDDNTASTGEIKCITRGFVSFTGKHGA
jgi:hypothetical protein